MVDCFLKYAMINFNYYCLRLQNERNIMKKLGRYPEKPDHTDTIQPFFYHPASFMSGSFLVADGKIPDRPLDLYSRLFLWAGRFRNGGL